ncbi:MAG: exopolysaccharide biosynthesis polyprenyl glycosylphosphotransferase [Verrucomicrobiales bacterium]|nr:exopolysaccharide biosynthesis polyprenyl glycosylphosphotransferase [Verrucomicrobiales bacterium]
MLRRYHQIRRQVHQWLDMSLFVIAFWLAHLFRDGVAMGWLVGWMPFLGDWLLTKLSDPIFSFDHYVPLYLIILPFAPLVLRAQGFYNRPLVFSRRQTYWALFKACAILVLSIIFVIFFSKTDLIARSVVIYFGGISFGLIWLKEELVRWGYKNKLGQEQVRRRLLLIGTKADTARLRAELKMNAGQEIESTAEVDLNETSIDDFVHLLHEHSINGVVINAKHTLFGQVEKAIQACELEGVEAWLVADFFKTQFSRTSIDDFYGRPVLVFQSGPEASWQGVVKQVIDVVGSALLLIVASFPLLVIAIWIRFSSKGPIIFKQQRSGLNGHPFTMYKFRTMVSDAEQRKQELAALNEMSGPVFKVTNDPRITPVGKWLRKTSCDELPQLWNVLRGEMSLVGPRPLPVEEVKRFDDFAHRRRLSVKPGITCLWQISGRNQISNFKDWVRLDLEYIDNWSIWLDIRILWRTVPVVLFAKGAK